MRLPALALVFTALSIAPAAAQNAENGADVFKKCRACHAIGPGATNRVGPQLNGLFGRKSGTVEGFNYSDANKNSGLTWDEATFTKYIKDPRGVMPGTKMVFPGIKDEADIKDLIAYMQTFAADGSTKK